MTTTASSDPAHHSWAGPALIAAGWATVAVTGGLATGPNIRGWYEKLRRPDWRPPNRLFGPVWTGLYTALAVSSVLLYRAPESPARSEALTAFAVNAVLNAAWSWLFFSFHLVGPAAFEISLVLLTTVWMVRAASRVSKPAAGLVVPYLLWVAFATALSWSIYALNR